MSHRINHTPNDNFYGGMFCSYNTCCPSIAEASLEEGQGGLGVAADHRPPPEFEGTYSKEDRKRQYSISSPPSHYQEII